MTLHRNDPTSDSWRLSFGKRPADELFDLIRDPECITNLADIPHYQIVKAALKPQLWRELRAQRDPRMFDQGQRFDQYIYADPRTRNFYERFMRGEPAKAGWVNPSDFE